LGPSSSEGPQKHFIFRRSSKTRLTCFPSIIYVQEPSDRDKVVHVMKGAVQEKDEPMPKLPMEKLRLGSGK
jgi:hypothetical protein